MKGEGLERGWGEDAAAEIARKQNAASHFREPAADLSSPSCFVWWKERRAFGTYVVRNACGAVSQKKKGKKERKGATTSHFS